MPYFQFGLSSIGTSAMIFIYHGTCALASPVIGLIVDKKVLEFISTIRKTSSNSIDGVITPQRYEIPISGRPRDGHDTRSCYFSHWFTGCWTSHVHPITPVRTCYFIMSPTRVKTNYFSSDFPGRSG